MIVLVQKKEHNKEWKVPRELKESEPEEEASD